MGATVPLMATQPMIGATAGKENNDADDEMALKANTAMRERRAVETVRGGVNRAAVELVIVSSRRYRDDAKNNVKN